MKSRHLIYLFFIQVLMFSCSSLMNKERSNTANETIYKSQLQLQEKQHAITITKETDSSNAEFTVSITPVGVFKYSAESGFSGEAKSLILHGKGDKTKEMIRKKIITSNLVTNSHIEEEKKLSTQQEKKQRHTPFIPLDYSRCIGFTFWLLPFHTLAKRLM